MAKCARSQKGITLIALIITIIVLLILSGVTLNMVVGDNGLINQAKESKNEYEEMVKNAQEDIDKMHNDLMGENGNTPEGTIIKVNKIILSQTTAELNVGETLNLGTGLTIEPENATNKNVIWSSSNSAIAKVDNGIVTAVSEGSATIIVKSTDGSNVSATCLIKVSDPLGGVTIPDGYYYVGGTKDSGVVISDEVADKEKYKGQENVGQDLVGNQWVWVPVEKPSSMYVTVAEPIAITGGSTKVVSGVTTSKYTASEIISGNNRVLPNEISYSFREPDILVGNGKQYDAVSTNWKTAGFSSLKNMAETLVKDYDDMTKSLETYKGFYIGRYELTANGEKQGTPLTNINWYNSYAKCKGLAKNDKVETRMIYGLQWDATCKWLEERGYNIRDSKDWGNYSNNTATGHGKKRNTGFSESWKANNIYDLAGNCFEWSQDAYNDDFRAGRGGAWDSEGAGTKVISYGSDCPDHRIENVSSRATLFIK